MYACIETQREDVVRQLVKREEIDPNIRDNEGNTAVIHAVHAGGYNRDPLPGCNLLLPYHTP